MENDEPLTLSAIQHFTFCKRQFGLLFVEGLWEENAFTVKGDLIHARADDPFFNESRGDRRVVRALPIYCDSLRLFGIADCVEFRKDVICGARIVQLDGNYRVTAIEYKSGKPDGDGTPKRFDAMQLYAQMCCLDEMFLTKSEGAVYYAKTRRRAALTIDDAIQIKFFQILAEMRIILKNREIPPVPVGQSCGGCSMRDVCLPKVKVKSAFYKDLDRKLSAEAK